MQVVLRLDGLNSQSLPANLGTALQSALATSVPAANANEILVTNVQPSAAAPALHPAAPDGESPFVCDCASPCMRVPCALVCVRVVVSCVCACMLSVALDRVIDEDICTADAELQQWN